MSLQDIRSECSDVAALLQLYIDAELSRDEQEHVALHLEHCPPCRAAVSEQIWVRAALRSVLQEPAPVGLRTRIMADLDAEDRATPTEEAPLELGKWRRRVRSFAWGGISLAPAAAAAAALFFVARSPDLEPDTAQLNAPKLSAALYGDQKPLFRRPRAAISGSPVAAFNEPTARPVNNAFPRRYIELVDAASEPQQSEGALLRFLVSTDGLPRQRVIIQQRPALDSPPTGRPLLYRGQHYFVDDGDDGWPVLHFQRSGVLHSVRFESQPTSLEQREGLAVLLETASKID